MTCRIFVLLVLVYLIQNVSIFLISRALAQAPGDQGIQAPGDQSVQVPVILFQNTQPEGHNNTDYFK